MKVFVTGATGYIGGSVSDRLVQSGFQVSGLVRFEEKAKLLKDRGIEPVLGSLDDTDVLTQAAKQSDGVIHAASADYQGVVEIFVSALEKSGKFFIHTTGSGIVNDQADGEYAAKTPITEDTYFEAVPFRQARVKMNRYVREAGIDHGIRTVLICPAMIYGQGRGLQADSDQLPKLIAFSKQVGAGVYFGNGLNRYSNVHIDDLVPEVWFENRWEASDPVRVVDLLEHTTGWDDMHFREYAKDAPAMGLREALDYDHHSRTSRWRPGTRMAYCNSGPAVAAYIVEKIAGQRFEDYVTQNFFGPIGIKTVTYFRPTSARLTTLYHPDGKTPYRYSNILYRPAGAINASANDMAAYVQFYLNRGTVNGTQVIPAESIDRMEVPTRTWAAKKGLKTGYGLSNYWSIHEGFVYHGHDGAIDGGLTEMAYVPDYGVGYFYSINAGNGDAFEKIGKTIRAYVTRELQKPSLPPLGPPSTNAAAYAGWYEPDSPRIEITHFIERLMGLAWVHFEDGKLLLTSLGERNQVFLPVIGTQYRYVPKKGLPDPVATVELLTPNAEGQFIQIGGGTVTMKHIPAWFAIAEIVLAVWVVLAIVSVLAYAPFWLLGGLSKKRRRPAERGMRGWPLFAVLSLVAFVVIFMLASDDPISLISRLGNLTGWSAALFLATVAYAVASVASAVALWRAPKQEVRSRIRRYSTAVTLALLIAAAYLAYWGIIGLRTWA
jgi:CubicO group peptidase (beta-lactamase class C family)